MTLTLLTLLSGVAHAQEDDARARELYENGVILYDEGRYGDAVVAWEEAYRLSPGRHVLLFNIANALERDGQYGRALETLNRYRAYAPASERDTLDRRIRNLEQRIRELPLPTSPLRDPLPSTTTAPVEPPPASGADRSPVPWLMVGGGAALILGGGYFGLQAKSAREDAALWCDDGGVCQEGAAEALRADRLNSVVADVSFVVGAGLITGGTVLMVRDGRGAATPVLGLRGRF